MKDKIEQLAKGEFFYELPTIFLSDEELNITVETGSTVDGCFTISNSKKTCMKGVLYSTSNVLTLDSQRFLGEENIISYHLNGKYLNAGEIVQGKINIVSDCGETTLPFRVKVENPSCNTSIGKIRDMFQFANLAGTDWLEAKRLFRTEEFATVLNYYDNKYSLIYDALIKSSKTSQAMDEFLVALHKKIQVKLSVDKTYYDYEYKDHPNNFMDKITLKKEGWGYLEIRISTDASFIELERKILWADNFLSNIFDVNFVVKSEEMKDGIHHGKIYIRTIYQTIAVNVKVNINKHQEERLERRKEKQYIVKLVKNYIDFRLNQLSPAKYSSEAEQILSKLIHKDSHVFLQLYRIHVTMIAGKEAKAKEYLERFDLKKYEGFNEERIILGILTYLKALQKKDAGSIQESRDFIRSMYETEGEAWILLWCLLYLDNTYEFNKTKKYDDIKNQSSQCNTPVLYYEAAFLLNENPALLRVLQGFELRVLAFALRREFMTKELARQVSYLAVKVKERTPLLYDLLELIYERYKLKETLTAICTNLIRDHQMNARAFYWYSIGVMEQLRITELPEYYIYGMNEKTYETIHPYVLTYFAYNNNLSDRKKAYFYANLVKHKESDSITYHSYETSIQKYALAKLALGSMNEHLAIIYDDVFHNIELTSEMAAFIPEVAFYYQIECCNENIKKIAVTHKELKNESIVTMSEGTALVEIFTENHEILLIDEQNQRYHTTLDYTINKLCHLEDLFLKCYELNNTNKKILLHMSSKVQTYQKFDSSSIEIRKQVVALNHITEELKREYIQTLIFYYYDNSETENLEGYLTQCNLNVMDEVSRNRIIEIMIIRDLYDIAYEGMKKFGYEDIDVKRLLRLCSGVIRNVGEKTEEDTMLVELCYYVYMKGKYDETILKYLVTYFNGTTEEMYRLWKVAKDFEVDTVEIEERLISQMLFTESYLGYAVPVFMSYYRAGFNRKIIRAFLSYYSYRYLVKNRVSEAEFFDVIRREAGYEGNDIYILALLKNYTFKYELTDSERHFVDYHLNQFEQKNVVLPFFKDYSKIMQIPLSIQDKYFVEYRTNPKNKVFIHYLLEGTDDQNQFITEEMTNVCYGIFVKEFILFQDDLLQYYITEEDEFSSSITESTEVRISTENLNHEDNKYHLLNLILAARDMKDEITMNKLLEQYLRMDYEITQLFHPIH